MRGVLPIAFILIHPTVEFPLFSKLLDLFCRVHLTGGGDAEAWVHFSL